jgi:TolB protein
MPPVRFALLLAAAVLVGAGGVAAVGIYLEGGAKEQPAIVFVSNRDGDQEIYAIREDGRGLRKLTDNNVRDSDPAWSPTGEQLAFVSDRDGDGEIYVMNADGSDVRQLTWNKGRPGRQGPWDGAPSWSPDGRRIVFTSWRSGEREIYTMTARGTQVRRLTRRRERWHDSLGPTWSPDGRTIAFASNRDGLLNLEIYTMRPDGSRVRRLTRTRRTRVIVVDDAMPAWSPDGRRIAFVSWRDGNSDIYLMNGDGSALARLTRSHQAGETVPRWSPDGASIVYSSVAGARSMIYVMSASGSGVRRLTDGWQPDWRPTD